LKHLFHDNTMSHMLEDFYRLLMMEITRIFCHKKEKSRCSVSVSFQSPDLPNLEVFL
jgi:hypothetical protein